MVGDVRPRFGDGSFDAYLPPLHTSALVPMRCDTSSHMRKLMPDLNPSESTKLDRLSDYSVGTS